MKINIEKYKIISGDNDNITIIVKKVNKLIFLGLGVPRSSSDVKRRRILVSSAFNRKGKNMKRKSSFKRDQGSCILCINSPNSSIYTGETWSLKGKESRKLEWKFLV